MADASTCSVSGCGSVSHRRGMCSKHYQRFMRTGSVELRERPATCSIEGCGKPHRRGGYCDTHYQRWWKHGDPLYVMRERNPNPPATCTEPGCDAPHYAKGQCRKHNTAAQYQANRAAIRERNRLHYLANKPMYFANAARRRQRVRANMDALDRKLAAAYREAIAGDPCRYCGAPSETVDHYFPLAKGGTDHYWNLVPACAGCNLSKAARCGTWFRLQPQPGSPARRLKPA